MKIIGIILLILFSVGLISLSRVRYTNAVRGTMMTMSRHFCQLQISFIRKHPVIFQETVQLQVKKPDTFSI